MKTRDGFVSNSSSSSFVLDRDHLSPFQVGLIADHIGVASRVLASWDDQEGAFPAPDFGYVEDSESWSVETLPGGNIRLSTDMDNFSMYSFLSHIGVPRAAILEEYY